MTWNEHRSLYQYNVNVFRKRVCIDCFCHVQRYYNAVLDSSGRIGGKIIIPFSKQWKALATMNVSLRRCVCSRLHFSQSTTDCFWSSSTLVLSPLERRMTRRDGMPRLPYHRMDAFWDPSLVTSRPQQKSGFKPRTMFSSHRFKRVEPFGLKVIAIRLGASCLRRSYSLPFIPSSHRNTPSLCPNSLTI